MPEIPATQNNPDLGSEAVAPAPLPSVHPDEWRELVQGVRALPVVTPAYLTDTLGYAAADAIPLWHELQAERVIAGKADKKGLYAVTEPDEFRRTQVATGRLVVGSVSHVSRGDRKKVDRTLRYSNNPFSWADLGEGTPSLPTAARYLRLDEAAPRIEKGPTGIEKRLAQRVGTVSVAASTGEYLADEPYWPSMVRRVAAAANLAKKRGAETAVISNSALGSVFDRKVDRLDADLIAGDAYAKLVVEGVLKPLEQAFDRRTGKQTIVRYEVLQDAQTILNNYGVSEVEPDFEDGDEPWRAIARDPANANIFKAAALSKLYDDINEEVRPTKNDKLDELNKNRSADEPKLKKLPDDAYAPIVNPVSDRQIAEYLDGLGVNDDSGEIAEAIKLAMLEAKDKLKRRERSR